MWLLAFIAAQMLGVAIIVYGVNELKAADGLQREFDSDPVCTRKLTLHTPPRKGLICSIETGTVEMTYSLVGSSRYDPAHDHIVVRIPGSPSTDVEIFDDFGSYLRDAKDDSPVVLETMDLVPARIATKDGAVSASGDPHMKYEGITIGIGTGAVVMLFGLVPLAFRGARRPKKV